MVVHHILSRQAMDDAIRWLAGFDACRNWDVARVCDRASHKEPACPRSWDGRPAQTTRAVWDGVSLRPAPHTLVATYRFESLAAAEAVARDWPELVGDEPAADINGMSLDEWAAYVDRLLEGGA